MHPTSFYTPSAIKQDCWVLTLINSVTVLNLLLSFIGRCDYHHQYRRLWLIGLLSVAYIGNLKIIKQNLLFILGLTYLTQTANKIEVYIIAVRYMVRCCSLTYVWITHFSELVSSRHGNDSSLAANDQNKTRIWACLSAIRSTQK